MALYSHLNRVAKCLFRDAENMAINMRLLFWYHYTIKQYAMQYQYHARVKQHALAHARTLARSLFFWSIFLGGGGGVSPKKKKP